MKIFNSNLDEIANEYAESYKTAWPFPHLVLSNFFNQELIHNCNLEFESLINNENYWKDPNQGFKERQNQKEKTPETKHENYSSTYAPSLNRYREKSEIETIYIKQLVQALESPEYVSFLENLTGINQLMTDPGKKSAGLNWSKHNSYLHIHSDNTWNPYLNAFRCINTSLYLNSDWPEDNGGNLELWNKEMTANKKITCGFNEYVIWSNYQPSFHGYQTVNCPINKYRKNLILLYYRKEWPDQLGNLPDKKSTATWITK